MEKKTDMLSTLVSLSIENEYLSSALVVWLHRYKTRFTFRTVKYFSQKSHAQNNTSSIFPWMCKTQHYIHSHLLYIWKSGTDEILAKNYSMWNMSKHIFTEMVTDNNYI